MELTRRKIKKVTNEKIMEDTNVIEYKIGDILKFSIYLVLMNRFISILFYI